MGYSTWDLVALPGTFGNTVLYDQSSRPPRCIGWEQALIQLSQRDVDWSGAHP
jgi:hypothetical protein